MKLIVLVEYEDADGWSVSMPPRRFPGRPISRAQIAGCLRQIAADLESHDPDETLPVLYEDDE